MMRTKAPPQPINPMLKLGIEIAPLAIFFFANARYGLMTATGAFMAATVVALTLSYALTRHIPTLPLVTGLFVMGFGGLTLALDDEVFIKVKPTVVNGLFAAILLGGLAFGRGLLKPLLNAAFQLTEQGWRKLSFRWALFFILLAILNEIVWRTMSTDDWVNFKVFAIMPLTLVFSLTQLPMMQRHALDKDSA